MRTNLSQFINYKAKGNYNFSVYPEKIVILDKNMDEILDIHNKVKEADIKTILKLYNIEEA